MNGLLYRVADIRRAPCDDERVQTARALGVSFGDKDK